MFTNRITRSIAVALAIAAAAAPAASARPVAGDDPAKEYTLPQGFQSADARDAAISRGIYEPIPPEDRPQDLRSADTRDYAEGRGTYNAPEVVVVEAPQPVAPPASAGGIDWADAGLGAGGLLAVSLMGAGGALFVVHRRGARRVAA